MFTYFIQKLIMFKILLNFISMVTIVRFLKIGSFFKNFWYLKLEFCHNRLCLWPSMKHGGTCYIQKPQIFRPKT
ncbi:hypothetical protein BpHYR1_012789 [Brachionus plicatilis]|uniref:Uncharacterized protein n=1 Tax=Brachionus plicatilis TaxID=10195 RepID=A0A3M7RLX6_BRAPC|nr:hypothetical protein BpHYR1_012789 [Brachionus plicatilis]